MNLTAVAAYHHDSRAPRRVFTSGTLLPHGACVVALAFVAGCGEITPLSPTGPSPAFSSALRAATPTPAPAPAPPAPGGSTSHRVSGIVPALTAGVQPCWADRYPCEVFEFTKHGEGAIEVTITWEGTPRALMVQLYWVGGGLAHEDLAPRTGPPVISFRRPLMEATSYRLRVVSLEPDRSIPFTMRISY